MKPTNKLLSELINNFIYLVAHTVCMSVIYTLHFLLTAVNAHCIKTVFTAASLCPLTYIQRLYQEISLNERFRGIH